MLLSEQDEPYLSTKTKLIDFNFNQFKYKINLWNKRLCHS
jgi:hypothetical protein